MLCGVKFCWSSPVSRWEVLEMLPRRKCNLHFSFFDTLRLTLKCHNIEFERKKWLGNGVRFIAAYWYASTSTGTLRVHLTSGCRNIECASIVIGHSGLHLCE